jgi:hypothetical protein
MTTTTTVPSPAVSARMADVVRRAHLLGAHHVALGQAIPRRVAAALFMHDKQLPFAELKWEVAAHSASETLWFSRQVAGMPLDECEQASARDLEIANRLVAMAMADEEEMLHPRLLIQVKVGADWVTL